MAVQKKYANGLGRGLDALITTEGVRTEGSSSINEIPLSQIHANPNQPRREFDEAALQELAESIRAIGIIQPITLRKVGEGDYQIIAGERRFRASQLAGLTTMPAYVRTADDEKVMEMALIENIQREDLNAMEIALAYQNLMEQHDMTQEKLSERVGKNRATIANYLRLLKLPAEVQMALKERTLDMGHARALLSLSSPSQQLELFHEIQRTGCSVRKVEEMAAALNAGGKSTKKSTRSNNDFKALQQHLASFFGTSVKLTRDDDGKGKIAIAFRNDEELEHIIALLDKLKA